jgi:hypothetical protein
MTVKLLWKCNELIVRQQELLRYYSNATTDLTCHSIFHTSVVYLPYASNKNCTEVQSVPKGPQPGVEYNV